MGHPIDRRRANAARPSASRGRRARGLAAVELVLCLPILVFLGALMVNAGFHAKWKVASEVASRHAAYATRHPRWGLSASFPRPPGWPAPKTWGPGGSPPPANWDPAVLAAVDHPVVRGPVLPLGRGTVTRELLDPTLGMCHGSASMDEPYPMLVLLGRCRLRTQTNLLENTWQYHELGVPSNGDWRIPGLYALASVPSHLSLAYFHAALRILDPALQRGLKPLVQDDEFLAYKQRFRWLDGQPDFHPRFPPEFCSLDHAMVREEVDRLIDRIQGKRDPRVAGVPENLTRWFIGFYRRAIRELEQLRDSVPPPPPDQIASINAEIADLKKKIATLDSFLQTLP